MPDERFIERLFERGIDALGGLTRQVSRVAFAVETVIFDELGQSRAEAVTCPTCSSALQIRSDNNCRACGEPLRKEPHGG